MKFIAIKPDIRTLQYLEGDDPFKAIERLGIDPMRTNHASLGKDVSIILDEIGLLREEQQEFFTLGNRLFAGPAIVYQIDDEGETIDTQPWVLEQIARACTFYNSRESVEAAIQRKNIERPQNGITTWKGGQPHTEIFWEWRP